VQYETQVEIVISSLKRFGKAEKVEAAGTEPVNGSAFSEEVTDDDVPF
jgi:hypothetical protein